MGNALGCPRRHRLKGVEFQEYSDGWKCDNCRKKSASRYRCIAGCDFDFCEDCMKPHLRDGHVKPFAKKETTLVLSVPKAVKPQNEIKHQHYLAEIKFKCNICGENDEGDRQHCPACLHNVCKACCIKKLLEVLVPPGEERPEIFTFESEPFGSGSNRLAFKATVFTKSGESHPYALKTWRPDVLEQCVKACVNLDMEQCVKIHLEAYRLAQEFGNEVTINHPIIFKKPVMMSMPSSITVDGKKVAEEGQDVMLEPFIFGEYDKYNSNNGWVDQSSVAPNAFTHYTWHKTKCLIVCDLQGNKQILSTEHDGYYFTDPAICSMEGKGTWGITDNGEEGIASFFQEHTCNAICEKWDKPANLKVPTIDRSKRTSFIMSDTSGCERENSESFLVRMLMKLMMPSKK